ncbi:MAG: alpha/beta hydrolase [Acidobacteriota bacterium]
MRGDVAALTARLVSTGSAPLRDARVRLVVEPAGVGAAVATEERDLATVAVGGVRDVAWAFDVSIAAGAYQLRAAVLDGDDAVVATSEPYAFTVTDRGAELAGSVTPTVPRFEPGGALEWLVDVENLGDAEVTASAVELQIVDPRSGGVLRTFAAAVDLDVGAAVELSWPDAAPVDGAGSALGSYLATLSATGSDGVRGPLASAAYVLADLSPPTVELLDPAPVCEPVLEARVRAEDRFSGIDAVTYGVDDGAAGLPMRLEAFDDDVWLTRIQIDPDRTEPYRVAVVARDTAGNASSPVTFDLEPELDVDPPVLAVDGPADGACAAGGTGVTFSAEDSNLESLRAWLDGAPYLAGTPIGDGVHSLRVVAVDGCGLAAEELRSFTVDSTAPVLAVALPPACAAGPVSATFSADDADLLEVVAWLDGEPYASGAPIGDGAHTLVVRATDACGNRSEETFAFTVDTEPPALDVDAPSGGACVAGPASATFSASDTSLASLAAWLDGEPYLSGAPIGDGPHTLVVRAADTCGRSSEETHVFTVDSAPPVLEVEAPAAGECTPGPASATFSASDSNLSSVAAWLNGEPYGSGEAIADGVHELLVRADDACGNVSEELFAFTVDSAPPTLDVDAPAPGSCVAGPVVATFSAADPTLESLRGWLDGEPYLSGEDIADGERDLQVVAVDACGRTAEDERQFTVDSTAPSFVVTGVEDNGIYDGPVTLEWRAVDDHLTVARGWLNGVEIGSLEPVNNPGTYVLHLEAEDCAGGAAELEWVFVIALAIDPLEIPTLHPVALLLLAALLAVAGVAALGQRPIDSPMNRRPGRGGRAMRARQKARRGRGSRWMAGLVWVLGLGGVGGQGPAGLAPAAWAQGPSVNGGTACPEQFEGVRRWLASKSSAPTSVEALLDELDIEAAIWRDEVKRRSAELDDGAEPALVEEKGVDGDTRDRLSRLDAEISGQLHALRAAVVAGDRVGAEKAVRGDFEKADSESADGHDLWRHCLAPPAEIERVLIPRKTPLRSGRAAAAAAAMSDGLPTARRPRPASAPPAGYLDPPSEALRGATRRAGRRSTEEKVAPGRPDPIEAVVTEVGADPVALYRFVREEIRPAHYFGQVRGPEATLWTGEGNDADQAGLLASLLRAAGLPARVAWGRRKIAVDDLAMHFGLGEGVGPAAVERVLTAAGIPWTPVLDGPQPSAYVLERAWCELYIPYANFRGVVLDETGSAWIALDPQLASHRSPPPSPALDRLGIDGRAFVDGYLDGADCATPLDGAGACPPPSQAIIERVTAQGEGDWGSRTAPPVAEPAEDVVLPAGLVGTVEAVRGFGIDFPPEMSHRVRLRARDGARLLLDETVAASVLSGREATLWYRPATVADAAVVAVYRDLWLTPPYLVQVRPEIFVDGESVAVGSGAIGMGETFELEVTLLTPSGDQRVFRNDHRSGVPLGFGVAPGASGYRPPEEGFGNTAETLATLVGSYLDGAADFASRLARLEGLVEIHPYPSFATVASVVEPQGLFGLIEELEWRSVAIDADVFGARVAVPGGGPDAPRIRGRWLELAQLEASTRERMIFEDFGMASASADLLLIEAARLGVERVNVDRSNIATVLPTLPFGPDVLDEIDNWVRAGGEAVVPRSEVNFGEVSGVGYVLRDPITGEVRYQLRSAHSGVLSGGMVATPVFEVVPEVASPLQRPTVTPVTFDGAAAVSLEVYAGNLQIGEVGERLERIELVVRDARGFLVSGADVTFEVVAGGGTFRSAKTITVRSGSGFASAEMILGTRTDESPYYLLFPEEEWAQRTDLTVVTARVNGYALRESIFAIAHPGEVTQLLTPNGTESTSHMHRSTNRSMRAIPADRFENPVANRDVTWTLMGSTPGGVNKGPELLTLDQRLGCPVVGPVIAGECPNQSSFTTAGPSTGVYAYLVAGEGPTHLVDATSGSASVRFQRRVIQTSPEQILISFFSRGQPRVGGDSVEAYRPGSAAFPLQATVVITEGEWNCPPGFFCSPSGEFTTRRLGTDGVPDCTDPSGAGGTVVEEATLVYDTPEGPVTVTSAVAEGTFDHAPLVPSVPGAYDYPVRLESYRVSVPVPQPPAGWEHCGENGFRRQLSGAFSSNQSDDFRIWAVDGDVESELPLVVLGHENFHDDEKRFSFSVEPASYPALSTAMAFYEDGSVPVFAFQEGLGEGEAVLPRGQFFNRPEGEHSAAVVVNAGYFWQPFGAERRPLGVETEPVPFDVLMFDFDLDSNNDNSFLPPEGDLVEENLESEGLGKFVFANVDDGDRDDRVGDGIPDFADAEVIGDRNLVPMLIELRPEQANYAGLELTFQFDGPSASDLTGYGEADNPIGDIKGWTLHDFSRFRTHTYRLWNVDSASSERRPSEDLIEPGRTYTAAELGFGVGTAEKTFFVEGINGARFGEDLESSPLDIDVRFADVDSAARLQLTVIEGNLALNHSNASQGELRVGVPDKEFTFDENDELVEDQGLGFLFWRGLEWGFIFGDELPSEDLMPMAADVPQELLEEWEVRVEFDSAVEEALLLWGAPRLPGSRLGHLRSASERERTFNFIDFRGGQVEYRTDGGDTPAIPFEEGNNIMLMSFAEVEDDGFLPEEQIYRLDLEVRRKDSDDPWIPMDSARLTLLRHDQLFEMWSSRYADADTGMDFFRFPRECHPQLECDFGGGEQPPQIIPIFPEPRRVDEAGRRDPEKTPTFVFVHGYGVDLEDAKDAAGTVAKRAYWQGFRGNVIAFTWEGNELWPAFAPNVANAFQTAPRFQEFIREVVSGEWQVPATSVYVMAHSLGNQVVADAVRLDAIENRELGPLFSRFMSVEAAIWQEAFWPQEDRPYNMLANGDWVYSVDDLRTNSWAFWYTNERHPMRSKLSSWIHSYSGSDLALLGMVVDDFLVRNPLMHAHWRWGANTWEVRQPLGGDFHFRNLAHSAPAMISPPDFPFPFPDFDVDEDTIPPRDPGIGSILPSPTDLILPYEVWDLLPPAGTAEIEHASDWMIENLSAWDNGWRLGRHSDHVNQDFEDVWKWWEKMLGDLPRGTERSE